MSKITATKIKCYERCPVFLTLSLIANKWAVGIIANLLHAPKYTMRFNQLQKALNGITQAELTKQLREFMKSGIVGRKVYPEIPPRVEYTLTTLGASLRDPINALSDWAKVHGTEVQENIKKCSEVIDTKN